jgi:hypothetical protein
MDDKIIVLIILAAHIEGLIYPPIFLFETLFSCHCPLIVTYSLMKKRKFH